MIKFNMNERFVENIKVLLRQNTVLYYFSKLCYSPIALYLYIKKYHTIKRKTREHILKLNSLELNSDKVFYFGVPIHENLGDAAQMYCIRKWVHTNYPNRELVEIETFPTYNNSVRNILEKIIKPNDLIICESGATFCNRHEDHGMHRYLLKNFKNNRIIFMPQTVDLTDCGQMEITARLFNENPLAVFLARDPESFRMVAEYFDKSRIRLFPDIVTSLIGNIEINSTRSGILVCKRIDGEKKYSDASIANLLNGLKALGIRLDMTDTNFDHTIEYTYAHLDEEIIGKLKMFSQYNVILTDRYHGMIFSLIANTPVVVLPTNGHKVREGAKWFKKDYPESIYFAETPEDAFILIKNILSQKVHVSNNSIYKEKYFDNLAKMI